MGALLLVAVIVAALITVVPKFADRSTAAVDAITAGNGIPSTSYGDDQRSPTPVDPNADDDGDGLTNEEEAALGTDPTKADSDGDGMSDTDEFDHGTDPTQGILPLTEENAGKPWERLGISEDEWHDLEKAILDQINPGGWKSFLFGDAAESIVLDENGELVLIPPGAMYGYKDGKLKVYPLKENGVGGGLVKGLAKILGAGGKSSAAALKGALEDLPASLRLRLASSGLLKGVEGATQTAKVLPRFQPGRWLPHFEKHAAEFGYRTPVEYLKGARDLTAPRGHRDLHAHQRRQALLRLRTQRVRGPAARRHPADILQAEGRLGLLAGAARQGMTADLDLDPEQREELQKDFPLLFILSIVSSNTELVLYLMLNISLFSSFIPI